jgi:S-DNA-T family DNA segregation ATPase FtsK/SpoIIIE
LYNNRYKIVIFGKNIYREYELNSNEISLIKVGTTKNCQVRFSKDNFFEEFEIDLVRIDGQWQIDAGDNLYFTTDGVMKIFSKNLSHGDEITIKYQNYNREIFKINFFIDFDAVERNYERIVDISGHQSVTIGGTDNCDIFIDDSLLGKDSITLTLNNNKYFLTDNNSKYGIYVNGQKASEQVEIKNYDFFAVVGYSFYLKNDRLYMSKGENIKVKTLRYSDYSEQKSVFKYPKFNRSTRIQYVVPSEEIEILPPVAAPSAPKNNIVMTLMPAIIMIALTVVLRGVMGGGGSFIIFSVATMSLGVVMTTIGIITDRRKYKKDIAERKDSYLKYISEKEEEITRYRQKELHILQKKYRSIEEVAEAAASFTKDLFDRDMKDEDFLSVTLGTGTVEASSKITYKKQDFKDTKDELLSIPEEIEKKYKYISNAPIIAKLSSAAAVGIVGANAALYNILKNLTVDICTRHFYKDVKLFYMFSEEEVDKFAWLRWFKHVNNEDTGIRNLIYNEESKNSIFEYLYIELSRREALAAESRDISFPTRYIIFVFDNKGINKHPISKYIASANKYGFTFVFFEASEDLLPKGCTEIIRLKNNEYAGEALLSVDGDNVTGFTFSPIQDKTAEEIALKLAPIYVDEVSLESELTKNISLFQLLNILSVEDLDIHSRWSNSEVYKSMAAPLGVKTKNSIVYLDLNEKKHGPHGLVAGTTGSGKSEILQSYILSMATLFHPYEVGFVIIDFKGGGMVNQFKDLPHLVGSITNIDGREIDRSLLSIKAELRKRQEIFAQYNVNHIDLYIKKFKAGEAALPLPHLILIVDEFAELKSDQPEFMKELISAARIGRSLGVHLILATQKPSGVVDNQIWSNSKFKLCLKVQTKEDSNEVLKTPLAAEIKEPGRAYLQVGNNEIFELFQSAYSGAPAESEDLGSQRSFELNTVSLWGKKITVFKQTGSKNKENSMTQLEAVVKHIGNYCETNSIERLPGICLPPLPEIIPYSEVRQPSKNMIQTAVAIGLYDDPSQQYQGQVTLNLSEGHTLIVGSSQFGKTSLLQTILRSTAQNYGPEEVNFYILDFGSMILKNFSELKHVGGVVTAANDEKLKNFIKMMISEIGYRKDLLSKMGLSSFNSYREAGYRDIPHIVILIDNFTAFKELYGEYDDDVLNICREGIAVGISLVMANLQTNGIGYKYLSNFANRISLYCNDSGEYSSLFDRCKMQPKNVPGRGLISIDKRVFEYQNYLGFDGEKEIERVKDMKNFIQTINANSHGRRARLIPEVPNLLSHEYIADNYTKVVVKKYEVPVGISYETVSLITMDMLKLGILAVAGREKTGKTNFLRIFMNTIYKNIFNYPVKAFIVDSVDRHLKDMKDFGFVDRYSIDSNDFAAILEEVNGELQSRQQILMEVGMEALEEEPLLLIIIQNRDAIAAVSTNKNALELYKKITKQYKALKVCFIFSDVEDTAVAFGAPEMLKLLKENKKAVVFDDLANHKFFDVPANVARAYKKPIEAGDAYYISGNDIVKIKTIFEK